MLRVILDSLPEEPHPRRGTCSAVYEGGFYVWHGSWNSQGPQGFKVDTSPFTLYRLDLQSLKWGIREMKGVDLPEYAALTCASFTQHHRFVFTFGGHFTRSWLSWGDPFCNSTYQIDLERLEVRLLSSNGQAPFSRDKTSIFFYKDALYMFGGWSSKPEHLQPGAKFHPHESHKYVGWNNEFYRYDLVAREWSYQDLKGEFPPPTAASDFARVGDRVYLVAGRNPPTRVDDVYILDLPTMEWRHFCKPVPPSPPAPWPAPRSSHAVSPIFRTGGTETPHLVLFGGLSPDDTAYDDVWLLDLTSMRWQQQQQLCGGCAANQLTGRTWFAMGAVLNNWSGCFEICLFGGYPGSLEDLGMDELSNTLVLEMGISSLKRLACSAVVANLHFLEKHLRSYLPSVCISNLRQMCAEGGAGIRSRVLSRFSPFKPFPDISHLNSTSDSAQ